MQRIIIAHVLLGLPGGISLTVAFIMMLLKFIDVGMGPELSWGVVIAVGVAGFVLIAIDAVLVAAFVRAEHDSFEEDFNSLKSRSR